jgi:hypothetical protein
MKTIKTILALGILSFLSGAAIAEETNDYNPNLLIFTGELDTFVEQADGLHRAGENQKEEEFDRLKQTGIRIARVYFEEMNTEIKSDLDLYLNRILDENENLKNYFVILGNAFLKQAEAFIEQREVKERKIKLWSTGGGLLIGAVAGGTYIYFKVSKGIALTSKTWGIAATAIVIGGVVGYAGGKIVGSKLPVDQSLSNSRAFYARYPSGEDFVEEIDQLSTDLALLGDEIEELEE